MIDFELTEEQKMVRDMVADFAKREIAPTIKENDEKGYFDKSIIQKMAAQGILGICIPQKYGGGGMDYNCLALACEGLEHVDTAARVILSVHVGLNSLTLLQWGTEEQKQKYLVPQAKGEKLATFGLTEPDAGSDVAGLKTTATKDKNGDYVLNGSKMWISLADVADNFLIFAYTDKSKGHNGISCFIVERGPGVQTATIHGKLGVRAGNTGEISLINCKVPRENLLGEEGEGFKIAMSALDNGRFTVASGSVGLAKACLEASVKYANERRAFGQKIGEFELIQRLIAKMVSGIEASELLVYKAGWLKNHGKRSTRETALAKWFATNVAFNSANDAIQIHGAYGFSNEYPVERYMRNSRGAIIYEGSNQIQEIMQGQYALGYRTDKPIRRELPKWEP